MKEIGALLPESVTIIYTEESFVYQKEDLEPYMAVLVCINR